MKTIWEKLPVISTFLASVLIPVVLAFVGHALTTAMKQGENRVRYSELAISILKEEPSDSNRDVRGWAVEVINRYSGVQMSARTKKYQVRTQLSRPIYENTDFRESSFRRSNFLRSDFSGATFSESLFRNASFAGSVFDGADLGNSSFDNTLLSRSSFDQADFRGANLSRIKYDDKTVFPPEM